ncbi:endopygalactorunase [Chitinophaga agrisoli]|uniref:Endopygalactorunase n=1 Tax=Chitinophaga agrisoli TaxID=2607653 RepID=A0A5B2VRT7_9BACT|nr:endopygalactorunase [Chitinophaga agrisoli]
MRRLVLMALLCITLTAEAFYVPGYGGPHIARISNDTVVVVSGRTYRYTVDTPEDSGLVSTITTVEALLQEMGDGYTVTDAHGTPKAAGPLVTGDRLVTQPTANHHPGVKSYYVLVQAMALGGTLTATRPAITLNTPQDITLHFTAGQRSPDVTVQLYLPPGVIATMEHTMVNVIGRGTVLLKDLATQSIGRTGIGYPYTRVGNATITPGSDGGQLVTLQHLDLRPANGTDVLLLIKNVTLTKPGAYTIRASYTTSQPDRLQSAPVSVSLMAVRTISDLERVPDKRTPYHETADVHLRWTAGKGMVKLQQSTDSGRHWVRTATQADNGQAQIRGLRPAQLYSFRLQVKDGPRKGYSNAVYYHSGPLDIKRFGASGADGEDNTAQINTAISYLHSIGGGTLLFSKGVYNVRTVHLQSNVWLYIDKDATIKSLKGADAPETTWFSDWRYRSGLSPTDIGPYADPENYLTKQDVGHHYFRNAMFFGERLDNVKIIGNGRISGNKNLVTGDKVMNNAPDSRADKMFVLKLCTNLEIGGLYRPHDLWYDSLKDVPFYINGPTDTDNMLHIDQAGHFVLLATGTDTISMHDTWLGKDNPSNARDIFDFMACNEVTVTNIYSRVSADDIIKPGSDCSLGFTRPARHYRVRNVIGDTNCNLFQVGSETADDIMDICVDNIYVLGANKAGFSISTNDGAHVKDIHLNCGHTGPIHSRSRMLRTTAPFFISISNRGRILGAKAGKYAFTEDGRKHNELLIRNVAIGQVENILINGIDISEVYGGSSFRGDRWKAYDGTQKKATSIIAGYALPDAAAVNGGLDFRLPDGRHTGYITNVSFTDVHITDKGGHPAADTLQSPPELGVGQYNIGDLKVQPSYGLWARHVKGLSIHQCSFRYEQPDGRYALFLDDVDSASIEDVQLLPPATHAQAVKLRNSHAVSIRMAP